MTSQSSGRGHDLLRCWINVIHPSVGPPGADSCDLEETLRLSLCDHWRRQGDGRRVFCLPFFERV